jgi:hypothetical protein
VINNYQVLLYNGLSLYGAMPLMLYALWDTWAAFMNLINALLLDKVGRIPIMVVGQVYPYVHPLGKADPFSDWLLHLRSWIYCLPC